MSPEKIAPQHLRAARPARRPISRRRSHSQAGVRRDADVAPERRLVHPSRRLVEELDRDGLSGPGLQREVEGDEVQIVAARDDVRLQECATVNAHDEAEVAARRGSDLEVERRIPLDRKSVV